jgi:hypothetical protein
MTKVKILSSAYTDTLERMINEFITTHDVHDIKFCTACGGNSTVHYSAMIVYEEG